MGKNSTTEELWQQRLTILQSIYATGIAILADTEIKKRLSHDNPDQWKHLGRLWDKFMALDEQLSGGPFPEDKTLRTEILTQAEANAKLFKQLTIHGEALKESVRDILENIEQTKRACQDVSPTHTAGLQVKA